MTCVDRFPSKKKKETNYRVWVKVRIGVGIAGKSWTELVPCGRRETRGVARGLPGWDWTPDKSDGSPSVPPQSFYLGILGVSKLKVYYVLTQ